MFMFHNNKETVYNRMKIQTHALPSSSHLDHVFTFIRLRFGDYFPTEGYYLLLCCIIVTFPLILLIILLTSCRRHRLRRYFQILFFFAIGTLQFIAMISTSWIEAEGECFIPEGPGKMARKTRLGFRTGIWDIIAYCESDGPFKHETAIHRIAVANVKVLHQEHLTAMKKGLATPLFVLTGQLGGEGKAWEGELGRCINTAASTILPFLVFIIYVWALWGINYRFARSVATSLMIMLGFLQLLSALTYFYILWTCPSVMLPIGGQKLKLQFGWPGLVTGGCGIMLCIIGLTIQLTKKLKTKPIKRYQLQIRDSRMSVAEIDDLEEMPITVFVFGNSEEENNIFKLKDIQMVEEDTFDDNNNQSLMSNKKNSLSFNKTYVH